MLYVCMYICIPIFQIYSSYGSRSAGTLPKKKMKMKVKQMKKMRKTNLEQSLSHQESVDAPYHTQSVLVTLRSVTFLSCKSAKILGVLYYINIRRFEFEQ